MDVFEQNNCKGLIFRAQRSAFKRKSGHYALQVDMRMLKRESCKGCDCCRGLLDYADEAIFECEGVEWQSAEWNGKYKLFADGDGEFTFKKIK